MDLEEKFIQERILHEKSEALMFEKIRELEDKIKELEADAKEVEDFISDAGSLYVYDGRAPYNLDELWQCMEASLKEYKDYKEHTQPTGICDICTAREPYKQAIEKIEEIVKKSKEDLCENCGWENSEDCNPTDYTCGVYLDILKYINKCKGDK